MCALRVWIVVFSGCLLLSFSRSSEHSSNLELRHHRSRRAVNATLRVTTILEKPLITRIPDSVEGDVRYEGFVVDILDAISEKTGITFNIHLVQDNRYGAPDQSRDVGWNGMIGEVIRGENDASEGNNVADMAAAGLTMTSSRRRVVHFINPFQHLGLKLLAKKQGPETAGAPPGGVVSSFRILAPLAPSVWCLCLVAFLVVSVLLWVMNRLNPYEWKSRHDIGRATEEQAEAFSLAGSIWFTFTTLQWQGYELSPRSTGARILAAFWFMFVTLSLVIYTASLVNNLFWASTVHGRDPRDLPFRDLEELLMHPEYKIVVLDGGSTSTYLKEMAQGAEFDLIRKSMRSGDGRVSFVRTIKEGVDRVRSDGKFVFITYSDTAKHLAVQQPCDLLLVGPTFAKRAYGMAVRKNMDAATIEALDHAILTLMEEGDIEAFEERWYGPGECWNVTRREKLSSRNTLVLNKPRTVDLDMFWAPLVLLLVGIVTAVGACVGEIVFYKYRGQYNPNNRAVGRKLSLGTDTA